jgi:hypothetical protein
MTPKEVERLRVALNYMLVMKPGVICGERLSAVYTLQTLGKWLVDKGGKCEEGLGAVFLKNISLINRDITMKRENWDRAMTEIHAIGNKLLTIYLTKA